MKRKCLEKADCAIARALDAIGDWWSLLIVRDALMGKRRFGEIQRNLGVARNILTVRLRKLVAGGVLEEVPASDGSAYSEYAITEKGRGLWVVLMALRQWGEEFLFEAGEQEPYLVDCERGEPVQAMELKAADGRTLGPEDVRVAPGRSD
jgi:DNA-binding HxlR family transcriptional regulator